MGHVRIFAALVFVFVCQLPKLGHTIPRESNGGALEPVGSYEGVSLRKIAVQDGFLFATDYDGHKLYAFDVTDPSSPALLTTEDLPELVWDVKASGKWPRVYVYLLGRSRFSIYEFGESENLSKVGHYDLLDGPSDICVKGSYAYIADGPGGLKVIDVSNPSRPYEVGCYKNASIIRVFASDFYAFVVSSGPGYSFIIVDISDSRSPYEVGRCDLKMGEIDGVGDISVSDLYAFLAYNGPMLGDWSVSVIEVSDVSKPVQVGKVGFGLINDLTAIDDYLFVCTGGDLQVFDISDIAEIRKVGDYYRFFPFYSISVSGFYTYIAGSSGLYILNWKGLLESVTVIPSTWGKVKAQVRKEGAKWQ